MICPANFWRHLSDGKTNLAIEQHKFHETAWSDYPRQLRDLILQYPAPRILELGGGRRPSFALSDLPDRVSSYTVNDVSADELALTAPEYDKACFDVAGDVSEFEGQFDVVFSRALAEHVQDGEAMHRNVLKLLKPGGVALHMIPTLYSWPFVLNRLLPERLSHKILVSLFPHRKTEAPKFPAFYSWCYGNRDKMTRMFKGIGYSKVDIRTFYGHHYLEKVPVLREIDNAVSELASKKDWSSYGSFAHVMAYK
jgi:SAM-dependent methyltransferase